MTEIDKDGCALCSDLGTIGLKRLEQNKRNNTQNMGKNMFPTFPALFKYT